MNQQFPTFLRAARFARNLLVILAITLRLCLANWVRSKFPSGWFLATTTYSPPTPIKLSQATIVFGANPGGTLLGATVTTAFVVALTVQNVNIQGKGGLVAMGENGDGAEISNTYLADGFTGDFEILYDAAVTYPGAFGTGAGDTQVSLVLPKAMFLSVASGGAPISAATYTITIWWVPDLSFKRKDNATLKFKFRHSPAIEGNPTA